MPWGKRWSREGLPYGGTVGQVLKKLSNRNYDADWQDESGASVGSVMTVVAASGAAQTLDCAGGQAAFDVTETADCVYTLVGAAEGVECVVVLVRHAAGFTPTLPVATWANDLPILATIDDGKSDVFVFTTFDGGDLWFASAFVTNATPPGLPSAPRNLAAVAGDTEVELSWDPPLDNVPASTQYKVYRRVGGGGYALLTTLGNVLSHIDTGLTNGTEYGYKIAAVNAIGEGSQTAEEAATPAASGPTVIVSDSFDRANDAGTLGDADTGETWVPFTSTWGISGNKAYCSALSAATVGFVLVNAGAADVDITCDITMEAAKFPSLAARFADDENYILVQAVAGVVRLYKLVAGVVTELDAGSAGLTHPDGETHTWRIVCNGNSITTYLDGVQIHDATESAHATVENHGLRCYDGPLTTGRFDNFEIVTP